MALNPIRFLAALSGVFLFSQAHADTSVRVYKDYPGNLFYAPYEVIPDHPACDAPDEFAFRATLSASDLSFRMYQSKSPDYLSVNYIEPVIRQPREVCYRSERRALKMTRFEIPCPDAPEKEPPRTPIGDQVSLDLSGEVTACMSTGGVRLLESRWQTEITTQSEMTIHEGPFSTREDWTSHPQRTYLRSSPNYLYPGYDHDLIAEEYRGNIQPRATLYYNYEAAIGRPVDGEPPVGYDAAQFRATLSCIPVSIPALSPDPMLIDAIVFFNLTKDDPQTCTGEICEGLRPPATQHTRGFVRRCLIYN